VPVYVSESVEQTPEHSSCRDVPLSHSVMVPSPLQIDVSPVHGGKHEDHHEGGVGLAMSAQLKPSSIDWHDDEMTSELKLPWQRAMV
jgi:hypothetical protein